MRITILSREQLELNQIYEKADIGNLNRHRLHEGLNIS